MKRSIITIAAGCALAGLSANANTITIGAVVVTPGAGFVDYTYPISTDNTTITSTPNAIQQVSFININDFGPATVVAATTNLPVSNASWTFTQPLVGTNTGNLIPDNPAVQDALFTYTGATTALPDTTTTYQITLRTTQLGAGGLAQWTTSDVATSGAGAGGPSAGQGPTRTPSGLTITTPDGGTTVALLGLALAGLAALRRRLTA